MHSEYLINYSLGVDHPQGQGRVEHLDCNVKFIHLLPDDLERNPFCIWISIGEHSHLPPPPTKTPQIILDEISDIIKRINDPNLTTGMA
jgi:hypothetical protein